MTEPIEQLNRAVRAAVRPDPLPSPPAWLSPEQRPAWEAGAMAGIRQGRRLAAEEHAAGWPLVPPADPEA